MVMEKWHCSRQGRYTRKPGRYSMKRLHFR
jgi:protocatechuate 3,4-dioxygenase beta subunit